MKKTKRILALIGAILLLLLYVVAFVATALDHTSDMRYWKAAVAQLSLSRYLSGRIHLYTDF